MASFCAAWFYAVSSVLLLTTDDSNKHAYYIFVRKLLLPFNYCLALYDVLMRCCFVFFLTLWFTYVCKFFDAMFCIYFGQTETF